MKDLNKWMDLPNRFYLGRAYVINDERQIIAAVVLEPETYALVPPGLR